MTSTATPEPSPPRAYVVKRWVTEPGGRQRTCWVVLRGSCIVDSFWSELLAEQECDRLNARPLEGD